MEHSIYTYSHKSKFSFHLVIPNGDGTNIFETSGYIYKTAKKAVIAANELLNRLT